MKELTLLGTDGLPSVGECLQITIFKTLLGRRQAIASISSPSLKNLFYKKEPLDVYDKYALKAIKNEALKEEIEDFTNYYRISPKRVETVLASL